MSAFKRQSPQPVVEGGTGIQSATAYAPLCGNNTSGFLSASTGQSNSGYVLTSNGSALPSWQVAPSPGSGALILLDTQTISTTVASVSFGSSFITSAYQTYFVLFSNVTNDTASVELLMDWSTNNGSSYLSSGYYAGNNYWTYNSATFTNTNSTSTNILSASLSQYSTIFGYIYLNFPQSTFYPSASGMLASAPGAGGSANIYNIGSVQASAVTINNIKFSYSSGNLIPFNGISTISLYGLKQ